MNIGFFVGHEKLLWQAKALVESITRLDCFTDSEIILVTRKKLANSFNDFNVKIMYIDNDYSRLPFCDKVYAASCFEQKITGQYLWLDVDSYFIKSVEFKNDNHIMLNSVDMRNIGNLYSEDLDEFWSILYQYFKLDNKQNKEITAITKEEIYPYFNIGMVLVNQNRSVFKQTYKALNEILNLDEISLLLNS